MELFYEANGKFRAEFQCVIGLHQLLPKLTRVAVVTDLWIGYGNSRDKKGNVEGRSGTGLKEDRTLSIHGGCNMHERTVTFQILLHDALEEQLHKLPSVQFVIVAGSTTAYFVHGKKPFCIGDK